MSASAVRNLELSARMINIYSDDHSCISRTEYLSMTRTMRNEGLTPASAKHRNAFWYEWSPTVWVWAKTLRWTP